MPYLLCYNASLLFINFVNWLSNLSCFAKIWMVFIFTKKFYSIMYIWKSLLCLKQKQQQQVTSIFLYFLHLKAFLDLCCHKEFILLKARPYVTIKCIYLLTLRHNNLASWPCTDSNLIPCSIWETKSKQKFVFFSFQNFILCYL